MINGRTRSAHPSVTPKRRSKPNSSGRLSRKLTKLAMTVTVGKTCGGKKTFLIRLAPSMMDVVPPSREEENQIQGRSPERRKAVYRSIPIRMYTEKTKA